MMCPDVHFARQPYPPLMSTTSLLVQSLPVLAQGAVLTVKFALLSMIFGLIAGAVLAVMGVSHNRALNWIARVYVSVFRGTPLLVQIFVIYYGLPSLGISLDPTPAGVIALSANVAASPAPASTTTSNRCSPTGLSSSSALKT